MNSNKKQLERKLVTIISADVVGYSKLMAEDEETTLFTFRSHKAIFEREVEIFHGRIFNTAGDAILAEFPSAVEAVRCAVSIQQSIREANERNAEGKPVRFRLGVNLGDVIVQGTDLLGDGVNIAARLQAGAEPGAICISGSVFDQIQHKIATQVQYLGSKAYKNIPDPVRTYAITEEGMRLALARIENNKGSVFPPSLPDELEKTGSITNLDFAKTKAAEIILSQSSTPKKLDGKKFINQETEIDFDPSVLAELKKPDYTSSALGEPIKRVNLNAKIELVRGNSSRKKERGEFDEEAEEENEKKGFLGKLIGKILGK